MLFAPDMENVFIPQELWDKLDSLEDILADLCDYLQGPNSVHNMHFYLISPPEPSALLQSITLQEGIEAFLSRVFNSVQLSNKEDLFWLYSNIMDEVLEPLHTSVYTITDHAWNFYDRLLKPKIMSISAVAICINDIWFLLMDEWSD